MRRVTLRRSLRIGAAVALVIGWSTTVLAGTGAKFVLPIKKPTGPPPMTNGLTLALDYEWADGDGGYRPMKLDVTSSAPAAGDRTLEIELKVGPMPSRGGIGVAFEMEIPAGATSVTKVVSVPVLGAMNFLSLDVSEDGEYLDDLSLKDFAISAGIGFRGFGQGDLPGILFVTDKPRNYSRFSFLFNDNYANYANNSTLLASVVSLPSFAERAPAALVENWINYSSLDVVFLSVADAENLAATRPKVWRALAEWTWAGGNLCVLGAGKDWKALAVIEELLACPASSDEAGTPFRGWTPPDKDLFHKRILSGNGVEQPYNEALEAAADAAEESADDGPALAPGATPDDAEVVEVDPSARPTSKRGKRLAPPQENPFVWKDVRLGRVVAIADDDLSTVSRRDLEWVFNTLSPAGWKWRFRHGLSLEYDNPDFDNLLISDVGLPPVRTYRVLITLFVLLIGPLNYWWLWRSGRLHLLLFTVPAAALAASLGLLAYVFIADGLESRVRVRSFTQLDQRGREAVSWARLSYYAGIAPSGGLVFGSDTAVLPLEKTPRNDMFGGRRRDLMWTPEQHLTRGWLAARTPTQYVTVRAYPSQRALLIAASDAEHLKLENRLGAKIRQVLVCDENGKVHVAKAVAAQGRAELTALADEAAITAATDAFLKELRRDAPALPAQVSDIAASTGLVPRLRSSYRAWQMQGDNHATSLSLLEKAIDEAGRRVARRELAPRSYVAIVDRPVDIALGTTGLVESQSLHVISGSW